MNWFKRTLSVALVVAISLSMVVISQAAQTKLGSPIPLTEANTGVEDSTKANAMAKNGYYTQDIQVGNTTRTAKVYLGKNATLRCYFTIVNVPDGMDTAEFLVASGWADLADQRGEGIFVLEPKASGWGSYAEEAEYLAAAFAAYNTRTWYSNFSTSYLVGYGTGGQALHSFAMENSMAMIGGVFINASEISSNFLKEVGSTPLDKSDLTKGDIPMPVWLINDKATTQNQEVINYWKKANDCVNIGTRMYDGSVQFAQKADSTNIVTSYSDTRSIVRVGTMSVNVLDPAFTRKAYNFMSGYTRYEATSVAGNALGARADYDKLGIEIYELEYEGLAREYLLYVPESVKASGEKAPLVLLLGGSTQTARIILDATHWWEIAEKEGFILVVPGSWSGELRWNHTADPTQRNDVKFIETVLDRVIATQPVDTTRCYSTGQSNGAMMTQLLAQQIPERFAAIGATSGGVTRDDLYDLDKRTSNLLIPTYILFGEYDLWGYDYVKDAGMNSLIRFFTVCNNTSDVLSPTSKTVDGRFVTYNWANSSGITLVKLTQTLGRPHNCIPSEMGLIWDWFSQWQRASNGSIAYNGKYVTTTQAGTKVPSI